MERIGFGPRFLAALIDGIIALLVVAILGVITGVGFVMNYGGMGGNINPTVTATSIRIFTILAAFFGLAYSSMEIFFAATPGKLILKQKIVRADGTLADQAMLIKRWAIKQSGNLIGLVVGITGILFLARIQQLAGLFVFVSCLMALRSTKLALHDDLAGTSVIGPTAGVVQSGFPVMPAGSVTPPPSNPQ